MSEATDPQSTMLPAPPAARGPAVWSGWAFLAAGLAFSTAANLLICVVAGRLTGNSSLFWQMTAGAFAINVVIFHCLAGFVHAATNRWMTSLTIVSAATALWLSGDILKLMLVDRPLLPSDLSLAGQMSDLSAAFIPQLKRSAPWIAAAFLSAAALFTLSLRRRRIVAAPRTRWISAVACGGLLAAMTILFSKSSVHDDQTPFLNFNPYNQRLNHDRNGVLAALLFNTTLLWTGNPHPGETTPGYYELTYHVREMASREIPARPVLVKDPVNVIVLLLEAFWDPTQLPVQFSEDPLPNFHRLQRTASAGAFSVPTYGGYTVRTEFETLTGCSLSYLYEVANPYNEYLAGNVAALPRLFAENGYATFGVHTFYEEFWDRLKAYPLLGFDRFLGYHSFPDPKLEGAYIADSELMHKIIETGETDRPFFIFGATMGTHMPYDFFDPQLRNEVRVLGEMPPESRATLSLYVNALHRTDKAIGELIDHYSRDARKTMIVMYGDHLPALGENQRIYRETGWLDPAVAHDEKLYRTPVVAWTNYDSPREKIDMRSNFLYSYILKHAGLPMSPFAELNARQARFNPRLADEAQNAEYRAAQEDFLFGAVDEQRAAPVKVSMADPRLAPAPAH